MKTYLRSSKFVARLAITPFVVIVLLIFVGCVGWSVQLSFTNSKLLPNGDFVGLDQYYRLFRTTRWIVSLKNMLLFGVFFVSGALILGFLLAILLDQKIRAEAFFRTIFLYPYSLSFVVTGLAWQWFLNPSLGLQNAVRELGWSSFTFDWLTDQSMAIYTIVIAAIWHGSGLVMALMLAGLRGVDPEIWRASKIDGIPTWRVYVHIVAPILGPVIFASVVLLSLSVVKGFDIVVAMTNGGPGIATEVPAKFVLDHILERANVGLAMAGATIMLITVISALAPWLYVQHMRKRNSP
ncbi:sugar ABC transporter permease [Phaeobacter inhibens]|uniref:carbohydrate ABC transporter permease n=1 Tax=Phaeobacter inhibens TaxID=221822 RepID=UPI000163335D|nr:sugar ABC transporter permease [Phaeobacter inhibens]AFO91640.1 ABC transporter, inner-membrane protein [Phaeobacter inhibens DSM 17395]AUQ46308.1 ABC transporter, inner-membrane protein [Phaeobacter inhibens]AXT23028.1 sugar ABC transporter permease [Phaeobacter inhibens]